MKSSLDLYMGWVVGNKRCFKIFTDALLLTVTFQTSQRNWHPIADWHHPTLLIGIRGNKFPLIIFFFVYGAHKNLLHTYLRQSAKYIKLKLSEYSELDSEWIG